MGKPQVAYRETIRKKAQAEGKYIRQTGGRGQYGHVKIRLEPNEPGKGYEFVNEIIGGSVPKEYIKPVEGHREPGGRHPGRLSDGGCEGVLYDGSYHDVDPARWRSRSPARWPSRKPPRRPPVLLEPVMAVEVVVPEEYMGDDHRRPQLAPRPYRGHGTPRRRAGDQGDGAAERDVRLRDRYALAAPRAGRPSPCTFRATRKRRARWRRKSSRECRARRPQGSCVAGCGEFSSER